MEDKEVDEITPQMLTTHKSQTSYCTLKDQRLLYPSFLIPSLISSSTLKKAIPSQTAC